MAKSSDNRVNKRIAFISLLIAPLFFVLIAKLFYIQVIKHNELLARANDQNQRYVSIESKRGTIYDRNMREMAVSIKTESIYLNPRNVSDPRETVRKISKTIHTKPFKLSKSLKEYRSFVWVKRQVTPELIKKVKDLDVKGIGFVEEYKRFYPKRELGGHVIGFVGIDNKGLEGLEYFHNDRLRGKSMRVRIERDALGRNIYRDDAGLKVPFSGYDLILTIDEVIQYVAEKELKKQVSRTQAKGGAVVVMDPYSGDVLALAEMPAFNPNIFPSYNPGIWRNSVVSDGYEPGSTFKIIEATAALEEKMIKPGDMIFCENGEIEVGGVTIRDHEKYGWLTFNDVIQKSSNIGAIKISQKLGNELFYDYIKRFGFGDKTGIDLPGEFPGLIRHPKEWSKVSIGAISIGQEILATPIQLINAMSSIANGGVLMRPRILKALAYKGKIVQETKKEEIRRVMSSKTSMIMKGVLKNVVSEGTGRLAAVNGFSAAGKTGTAQKYDVKLKAYSKDRYLASFVGFVPVKDPKVAILVIIDEPKESFWGGEVAAPVFSRVAEQVFRYMMVPTEKDRLYVRYDDRVKERENEIAGSPEKRFFSDISSRILSSLSGYFGFHKKKVVLKLEKKEKSG
jgi:cell division protein FtsI (penicillin-binding protein 3)